MNRPRFSVDRIIEVQNKIGEQHANSNPSVETLRVNLTRSDITVISWALALATADGMGIELRPEKAGLAFEDPASHPAALRMICRRLDDTDKRVEAIELAREGNDRSRPIPGGA